MECRLGAMPSMQLLFTGINDTALAISVCILIHQPYAPTNPILGALFKH